MRPNRQRIDDERTSKRAEDLEREEARSEELSPPL